MKQKEKDRLIKSVLMGYGDFKETYKIFKDSKKKEKEDDRKKG